MNGQKQLEKVYNPQVVENRWYDYWEKIGAFAPNMDTTKESFTIVMPPPNVTGKLHMGHAMDNTMQDILIRYKRLRGFNTLWVPGTDHAGIATQAKVEAQLRQEGILKDDLGRDAFVERCWEWKNEYGNAITEQIRKLGASCDWERERFTMDEGCSRAVREAFVNLYEKDLIYQGNYIVNWCPHCQTTISDIEVEYSEHHGELYYLNYHLEDGSDFLTIATTRPETMFGDTGVAVHPDDARYAHFIGKKVILPIIGRAIPVVADEYVDMEFGTGAVKITPSHDVNDFEMGKRHNLEQVVVIDKFGIMNDNAGPYVGLDRHDCRKKVIEDLRGTQAFNRAEEYTNAVGQCYRCDTVTEPLVSKQWFVRMQPLADPALKAAYTGDVRFVPERFTKIYTGWLENIRDWCISRQLWWGHRIPVWYCDDCGEVICTREDPTVCPTCSSSTLRRDEDVLDTWFSSALWPFEVLGWPDQTVDLDTFYPTDVLVTGRDIIFFWVARMIFSAYEFTDQRPFKDVLIHGLVLDELGRKMSKSLGNGIDPLEEIAQYGADALRLTLITGNTPGNDVRYRQDKIESSRNFTNKLWNATRFVLMHLQDFEEKVSAPAQNDLADRWIVSRFNAVSAEMAVALDKYELGEAARTIHDFIWDEFCDWYIELIKPRLYGHISDESRDDARRTAAWVLRETCVLLHAFMPFITEEIWQVLPHEGQTIMTAAWPTANEQYQDAAAEADMAVIIDSIRSVRALRRDTGIPTAKKVTLLMQPTNAAQKTLLDSRQRDFSLANCEEVILIEAAPEDHEQMAGGVVHGMEYFIPLKDILDIAKEIERIEDQVARLHGEIARIDKKLSNEGFIAKAPADVVDKERQKRIAYESDLAAAEQQLQRFKTL